MKNKLTMIAIMCAACILAVGCGAKSADKPAEVTAAVEETKPVEVAAPVEENQIKVADNNVEESPAAESIEDENAAEVNAAEEKVADDTEEGPDDFEKPEVPDTSNPKTKAIVWLGESLTQGSLGDNNDNLPGAPYETLKKLVKVPVEGYGLYGTNTHDIFWAYRDEDHYNQKVDPDKTYIFWVGSCDWCPEEGPNANTAPVIAEIDNFIAQNGGVKNYIVIGTTSRHRLGDLYIPINKDLAAHYGVHYMDCIDIINKYGYSPDRTHLSQATYDAVANAVYQKLKTLGYI